MIYITESYSGKDTVVINVEGELDSESLPVLDEIYQKRLETGKRIAVNLDKISSVDRAGKEFLRKIQDTVQFIGIPLHIQMEIGN